MSGECSNLVHPDHHSLRVPSYLMSVAATLCPPDRVDWAANRFYLAIEACEYAKISVTLLGNEPKEKMEAAVRYIRDKGAPEPGKLFLWSVAVLLVTDDAVRFYNNMADGSSAERVGEASGQLGITLFGTVASATTIPLLEETKAGPFNAKAAVVAAVVRMRHEQDYVIAELKNWVTHIEAVVASSDDGVARMRLDAYRAEIARKCERDGKASVATLLRAFERALATIPAARHLTPGCATSTSASASASASAPASASASPSSASFILERYLAVHADWTPKRRERGAEVTLTMASALTERGVFVRLGNESAETRKRMSDAMRDATNIIDARLITTRSELDAWARSSNDLLTVAWDGKYLFAFGVRVVIEMADKTIFFIVPTPSLTEDEDAAAAIPPLLDEALSPFVRAIDRIEQVEAQLLVVAAEAANNAAGPAEGIAKRDALLRAFLDADRDAAIRGEYGWGPYIKNEEKRIVTNMVAMFDAYLAERASEKSAVAERAAAAEAMEAVGAAISPAIEEALAELFVSGEGRGVEAIEEADAMTLGAAARAVARGEAARGDAARKAREAREAREAAEARAAKAAAEAAAAREAAEAEATEARRSAEADAERAAEQLLAEEEAEKAAEAAKAAAKAAKNKKKKKRGGGGRGGGGTVLASLAEEAAAEMEEAGAAEEADATRDDDAASVSTSTASSAPSSSFVPLSTASHTTHEALPPPPPESSAGGDSTCVVCFMRPKTHLAFPCGHLCACARCSSKMLSCPLCRAEDVVWVVVR